MGYFIWPNVYIDYFISLVGNQIAGLATLGFAHLAGDIIRYNMLWYITMITLYTIYRTIIKELLFRYSFKRILQTGSITLVPLWLIFIFLAGYLPGIEYASFFKTFIFAIILLIMVPITMLGIRHLIYVILVSIKRKRK